MSTDFFQQQNAARQRTTKLRLLFVLAVVAIVGAVYPVVAGIVLLITCGAAKAPPTWADLWRPAVFLWVSLGTLTIIALGTLCKIVELAKGGEVVALLLGGRRVDPRTTDLAERRLLNVVEEMAVASGVPVPPVYVLDKEPTINAFAAGHTPANAVIGVSRGALGYLNRDELQGIMAHEFSHILNGDMLLNVRLIGWLFGILLLAVLGFFSMHAGRELKCKGPGFWLLVFGVGLYIVGYIGVVFASLIKAIISRQREYLADASAVQFTRLPSGIAGALKKIGGLEHHARIQDPHAEECSHLFFGNAVEGSMFNLFSTHPPLVKRIRRIDPSFDGRFPRVQPLPTPQVIAAVPAPAVAQEVPAAVEKGPRTPQPKALPLEPASVTGQVGTPGPAQIVFASALLNAMPQPVGDASHDPYSARAVVYALLLNREKEMRQKQLADLKSRAEELSYRETLRMAAEVDQLAEEARLPLVDVTLPALKSLSRDQYAAFRQNVEALVAADGKMDLFEYMVHTVLLNNLDIHFGRTKPPAIRYRSLTSLMAPRVRVLSTLAYAGQLASKESPPAQMLRALDEALRELAHTTPRIKQRVLSAAAACVIKDGKVTVREGELLRAVAAMLGCPMPPLAASVGAALSSES